MNFGFDQSSNIADNAILISYCLSSFDHAGCVESAGHFKLAQLHSVPWKCRFSCRGVVFVPSNKSVRSG